MTWIASWSDELLDFGGTDGKTVFSNIHFTDAIEVSLEWQVSVAGRPKDFNPSPVIDIFRMSHPKVQVIIEIID